MLTLLRAQAGKGEAGESLPVVFNKLQDATAKFRRGQVTLIAAAPGVGKSIFALRLCLGTGSPCLYLSGDTDSFTMALRAASMVTGHSVRDVETRYEIDNGGYYDKHLESYQHIRFDFEPNITAENIEAQLTAYALTFGEYPHILVVDNLSNIDLGEDSGEGYQALERALDFLHELARQTGTAVIALHHLTGNYDDGNTPAPLSSLRGKVSKVPEMVLTLYRAGTPDFPSLGVAVVKNRNGKMDTTGAYSVVLSYDPERMQVNG